MQAFNDNVVDSMDPGSISNMAGNMNDVIAADVRIG